MASRARQGVALCALAGLAACFGGGSYTPIQTAFNRGVYLDSVGSHAEAVAEYPDAVAERAGDDRARFNLAAAREAWADQLEAAEDTFAAEEQRRLAREEYERLLRQSPDHPRASVNLAAIEYGEDPAGGKQRLRDLIDRHPDRVRPRAALAAHLLYEGDAPAALELLEVAHQQEPANFQVNLLLGDARLATEDLDGARSAYEAARRRDGDDLSALMALGEVETRAGDLARAMSWYREVLLVDPDHFRAHLALADLCEATGDAEDAVLHLWAARRLEPGSMSGGEVSMRLVALYEQLLEAERK